MHFYYLKDANSRLAQNEYDLIENVFKKAAADGV